MMKCFCRQESRVENAIHLFHAQYGVVASQMGENVNDGEGALNKNAGHAEEALGLLDRFWIEHDRTLKTVRSSKEQGTACSCCYKVRPFRGTSLVLEQVHGGLQPGEFTSQVPLYNVRTPLENPPSSSS